MSIRKRTLPSGHSSWIADYRDQTGRRRNKSFARKKDAERYLEEIRPLLRDGTFVADDQSITISEASAVFLRAAETRGVANSTYRQYEQHTRLHIVPRLGSVRLTKLTAPMIYDFLDDMRSGNSAAMTKKVLTTLNSLLREGCARGLVGRNVIEDRAIKPPKVEAPALRLPEKKELRALLNASFGWHHTFLMAAMLTGMRKGELRALKWEDIDFDKSLIRVRRSAELLGRLKDTKTGAGRRDIPIGQSLLLSLKEWKLACPRGTLGLVFPNGLGNVESDGNISNRVFYPAMEKAGLMDEVDSHRFRFHDLRHAAAALFIEQGLGPKRIQTLMGHSSIKVTFDIYGYLFRNEDADAAAVDAIADRLLRG